MEKTSGTVLSLQMELRKNASVGYMLKPDEQVAD
tara:strand:+ start:765 stop:866 length:102 start_codon:yes stop_codon:yes gene_type:complete